MNQRVRNLLRGIKSSPAGRILNIPLRANYASRVALGGALRIPAWLINSREDTNFTYPLTDRSLDYLAHTLAVVTGQPARLARDYIDEAIGDEDLARHVVQLTESGPYRSFADARCDFAKRLGWYATARLLRPEVIVETGVDKGLGSVILCAALLRNGTGRYYGTDINPDAGFFLKGRYAEVGEILFGDSIQSLTALRGTINLFINDSDHSADYELAEYRAITPKLSPGAVVLGDNAHCTTKLSEWASETGRHFLFWREEPAGHWYPGGGIGFAFS